MTMKSEIRTAHPHKISGYIFVCFMRDILFWRIIESNNADTRRNRLKLFVSTPTCKKIWEIPIIQRGCHRTFKNY
jgi:hypothetical protein